VWGWVQLPMWGLSMGPYHGAKCRETRDGGNTCEMHIDVCCTCKIGLLKMSGRSRIKLRCGCQRCGAVWSVRRLRPRLGS